MKYLKNTIRLLSLIALTIFFENTVSAQSLQDDTIRANYLIRFVDFIRWERPLNEPVSIGVMGSPSLLRELNSIAAEKQKSGREFRISEFTVEKDESTYDLIYVASGRKQVWQEIISRAQASSVVSVSDEAGFLDAGGLIEFSVQKNRLRFYLNLDAAEDYGVNLSSKLIQLSAK
ncbi:YfiR family protein [Pelagicoccus albus]|uniref:YfiR family protein n=1 Tax=Pelagicoccus albus TaxID=415222 RepID=A0A7X1BBV1_9BACT|nr:YfiR family protein [Pelagicoccus albus]MBC2608173.1 YfiR family protein [Pelagicoccus albus]